MAEKTNAPVKSYDFGEKTQEFVDGANIPVWQSPKYETSRQSAINLLESKEFGGVLTEGDFWILMNKTKSGKMAYTGLIISHDALLKINNVLPEDKRFDQKYLSEPIACEFAGTKGYKQVYRDERDGMYEVGEITPGNCKNAYTWAMLSKRIFDRVVKRKANLSGIYSDSEADEFKETIVDVETGEVIEKAKPKGKTQTKSASIPVPPAETEKEQPQLVMVPLADALKHPFEGGSVWKGKAVSALVDAKETIAHKQKLLNMYMTRGSEADKNACKVVVEAIKAGELKFQNSIEAAS